MSRYAARIRQLEHKLAPTACPVCAGYPAIAFVTIHGDETPPPPPPPCEACGKLATRFIVHHAADEVAHSQQPAAEPFSPRAPAAEGVPPAHEHNARAESQSKPLVKRRRYCG
jgi:hypothetical protein